MITLILISSVALAGLGWQAWRRRPVHRLADGEALAGESASAARGARAVHALMFQRAQWHQVLSSCARLLDDNGRLDLQRVAQFYEHDPHRGLWVILSACNELAAKDPAATFNNAVAQARVYTWGDV